MCIRLQVNFHHPSSYPGNHNRSNFFNLGKKLEQKEYAVDSGNLEGKKNEVRRDRV
jgi:hypothetical protein